VQDLHAHQSRDYQFPDFMGAVDRWKDKWHESEESGFRRSGFPTAGNFVSRIRDPRNPEVTLQSGARKKGESRWYLIKNRYIRLRGSAFGEVSVL
jgi:hypothetical protein